MTNVNVSNRDLLPQAGADGQGRKIAFLSGVAKAAQNDTITLVGAKKVLWACLTDDTTGALDATTLSTNVITCTAATTGTVSGVVVYR